jgi:hypothetical protein
MSEKTSKRGLSGARMTTSKVAGGMIKRDAKTGRFVEVSSDKGTYRAKPNSEAAIKKAAEDRHEALKRLANR